MMQLRPRELVIVLQFPLHQPNKKGMTAPKGPPVMLHSGKTADKAIASTANAEKNHDERKDDPNRIKHVPGENLCFIVSFLLIKLIAKFSTLQFHYPNNQSLLRRVIY